ncbi:MAG TPA: hypothetical protein VGC68_03840 [Enterovirga sp.]
MPMPVMMAAAAHATADMRAGAVTDCAPCDGANRPTHEGAGTGAERAIDQAFLRLRRSRRAEQPRRKCRNGQKPSHLAFPSIRRHACQTKAGGKFSFRKGGAARLLKRGMVNHWRIQTTAILVGFHAASGAAALRLSCKLFAASWALDDGDLQT